MATSCTTGYYLSTTNTCTLCSTSTSACAPECLKAGFYNDAKSLCTACSTVAAASGVTCGNGCENWGFFLES